jgi:Gluconate 2-dehydrogenase subunit 3
MKRRSILTSFMAVPAAAAAAQSVNPAASSEEYPKLTVDSVESTATGVSRFFSKTQFEALTGLADAIVPASANRPAASQAGVAEFLDFLIGQSPSPVQELYRQGLDRLAREGVSDRTLSPLTEAWTYSGPTDRFAEFLQRAKGDIIQAAMNSREWAESLGRGRRGSAPTGYYWRSLD